MKVNNAVEVVVMMKVVSNVVLQERNALIKILVNKCNKLIKKQ